MGEHHSNFALLRLASAWPLLPKLIREAVLALVRASEPTDSIPPEAGLDDTLPPGIDVRSGS